MRVLVLHSDVAPDAPPDELDTLDSAEAVAKALQSRGHRATKAAFAPDMGFLKGLIETHRPDVVFNVVESVFGAGIYSSLAPAMLDRLNIPYTGATAAHFAATTDKPFGKNVLRVGGVETPAWSTGPEWEGLDPEAPYIVKAADEDSSVGIDDLSVVPGRSVRARTELCRQKFGGRWFAEAYVDGREFNIAVMAGPEGPFVFPLAEMRFNDGWPAGKPKLVSFAAKWEEDTFDYNGSQRRFGCESDEPELARQLVEITKKVWHLFSLRGYARVDFRVDADGKPWVLEINPNCCISTDAGFAAAGEQAGIPYDELIERVTLAALKV
ncbi:MAG: ATP-grasp domain-containing protein [Alphaproteobacteria bacterium]|nr:ATP-grasp domain-containing protein [Alphaproteobacteria bacterium]MBV9694241.1 ATP-grasp domain-containing protein [Alphaproteobacteria bacterium]